MTQELRVGRELPRLGAAVVDVVDQIDGVRASLENEGLGHGQTFAIAPGERYAQLIDAVVQFVRRRC